MELHICRTTPPKPPPLEPAVYRQSSAMCLTKICVRPQCSAVLRSWSPEKISAGILSAQWLGPLILIQARCIPDCLQRLQLLQPDLEAKAFYLCAVRRHAFADCTLLPHNTGSPGTVTDCRTRLLCLRQGDCGLSWHAPTASAAMHNCRTGHTLCDAVAANYGLTVVAVVPGRLPHGFLNHTSTPW